MKVASYTTGVQYIWKINKLEASSRQQLAQQSMLVSMLCSGGVWGPTPRKFSKISPSELDSGVIFTQLFEDTCNTKASPIPHADKYSF